jgi:hypothetical protein
MKERLNRCDIVNRGEFVGWLDNALPDMW